MINNNYKLIILLFIGFNSYGQISDDSCWTLLRNEQYDVLLENLNGENFQTYFFRAKVNRKRNELEKGIKNIQKALSYFSSNDYSTEYASALEEYSVLQRHSGYKLNKVILPLYKSLNIRKQSKDSSALATTYLYLGNTYISYDTITNAADSTIKYYQLAANYYPKYDYYNRAVLEHNLGPYYVAKGNYNKALQAYKSSGSTFMKLEKYEDYLWTKLGESDVHFEMGQTHRIKTILDSISRDTTIDKGIFLKKAILSSYYDLYITLKDYKKAYEINDSLQIINHLVFNEQQQQANEKYKNERLNIQLLREELLSAKRKSIIFTLLSLVFILGCGFITYYFIQKQKKQIRDQHLLIEKQQALQNERNRIAGEMHDDLGGGLTTIKFVSQRVLRKLENSNDKALLQKIVNQSDALVKNMSEIIWAMNSKFDNLESTIAYMRRYAMEYLKDFNIELAFNSIEFRTNFNLSSTIRRNLLLVMKEALNNVVKHSQATSVNIWMEERNGTLKILIKDNGIGIYSQNIIGNGIGNMKERVTTLSGSINFKTMDNGLIIRITIPLKIEE